MKAILSTFFAVLVVGVLAGCGGATGKTLLTVDFQEGQTLRYRFVSDRQTTLDWGAAQGGSKSKQRKVDTFHEKMDMVVAYTPIEIKPFDSATVKATYESIKTSRSGRKLQPGSGNDPIQTLVGKTFTFTVGPTGKIEDYSQMEALIRQAGEKAIRHSGKQGRVKGPDMTDDLIATQRFLWDSVSSMENPLEGIQVGKTWNSKLSVPTQMVLRKARNVTYTLDEIRPTQQGQIAVIRSSYSPAKSAPRNWPIAYTGKFQISGTFGFLRGYRVTKLQGEGEELFNIDTGRTEKYNQKYQVELNCSMPMGLGGAIPITVKQNLTMQLLP